MFASLNLCMSLTFTMTAVYWDGRGEHYHFNQHFKIEKNVGRNRIAILNIFFIIFSNNSQALVTIKAFIMCLLRPVISAGWNFQYNMGRFSMKVAQGTLPHCWNINVTPSLGH